MTVKASMSALIPAPAPAVCALIADYRFEVRLGGTTRRVRAEVSEPRPGEALVETDLATGARTTFLVMPRPGGRFFNNAARFLRIPPERIAAMRGKK